MNSAWTQRQFVPSYDAPVRLGQNVGRIALDVATRRWSRRCWPASYDSAGVRPDRQAGSGRGGMEGLKV